MFAYDVVTAWSNTGLIRRCLIILTNAFIGGSRRGGVPGTRPPYGTQFFHFHIQFHQKVPTSEVHAPPNGCTPPPTGNPGSATGIIPTHNALTVIHTGKHLKEVRYENFDW